MMKISPNSPHRPDSLTGAIAAFEGINEACTLLNSPIGCKFYPSFISSLQVPRCEPNNFAEFSPFFFGQRRVPCTFIDKEDFVYGTETKITQALNLLESKKYELIGVINHSGTSLIGDDINRIIRKTNIKTKTVAIESSGFTGSFADGYKDAVINILRAITKKGLRKKPKSVNILGLSIFNYNWENDVAELKRMLALLGIRVVSVICVGESLRNIERAGQAHLNLVVNEEYGDTVAAFLEKEYGIPSIGPAIGAPFGLTNSESWLKAVTDQFKLSHQNITLESKRIRMKCYPALFRATSIANNIRGSSFAVFGDSSQVASIVVFLYQYLGMYPVVIGLREIGAESIHFLKKFLSDNSVDCQVLFNPDQYEIIDSLNQYNPRLVLGSSIEEHLCPMLKEPASFIPISFPYHEKIQLTMRPLVGFNGVLTLVEEIINSLT